MKIVHWAKYYPPEWGGMERVTVDLANGMAACDIATVVVAFSRDAGLPASEERDGVRVIRARQLAQPLNQPISPRWIWQCVAQSFRADAVIVHAPNLLAAIPAIMLLFCGLFGRGPKTRIVLWHSDVVDKGMLGKLLQPIEHLLAIFATCIVATSPPYAAGSSLLSRYPAKIRIIPIGIRSPEPPSVQQIISPEIGKLVTGRPIILSVGRLVGYKGYRDLVAAAALLKREYTLLIVGTGPDAGALARQISDLGLNDNVFLVGGCSQQDLDFLFRSASIFALASCKKSEAFGVVLLEAMSHGLPIVACDIPGSGVPWVARNLENALISPVNEPHSLAVNIDRLLSDADLMAEMGQRGFSMFAERFTLSNAVQAYVKLAEARGKS
jgi:glycosyltransferase involved in cell wall biosynthesis